MKKTHIILLFIVFCGILAGCVSEDLLNKGNRERGYSFQAVLQDYEEFTTRSFNRKDTDDCWSIARFEDDDVIGFYSKFGGGDADDGNGVVANVPMTYNGGNFYNEDLVYNTEFFQPSTTFYYFPYHNNIDYDPEHTSYDPNDDYGYELRKLDEDGIEKCEDVIWMFNESSAVGSKRLSHTFSSIVFLRGDGFKKAKNRSIKVVLDKPVSHLTVSDATDSYYKNFQLVYLDGYRAEKGWTADSCRCWYAWQGDPAKPYIVKDTESEYFGDKFYDAQYIILPTAREESAKPGSERLSVDHIEIYDDDDKLQIVTNFYLYKRSGEGGETKILYYGHRYPLMIKKVETETVVSPISIAPWGDIKEVDKTISKGINTSAEFRDWINAYGQYLEDGRPITSENDLAQFGDNTVIESANGDKTESWKFYINADLDLSGYLTGNQIGNTRWLLEKFEDTLEGNNFTIKGLSLDYQSSPPCFIGELSGTIQNLNFKGLTMTSAGSSSEEAGGIFKTLTGKFVNCDVDGVVSANGPVGMIAGHAENATISGCTLSGLVIGTSTTQKGMFGSILNSAVTNNNTGGLMFQSKQ